MLNRLSSVKRTTRRTRRRSRKPPAGRLCASSPSRTRPSRRAPCCFAPAIFWCASAPNLSTRCAAIWPNMGSLRHRPTNVKALAQAVEDFGAPSPLLVVELARVYLDQIDRLSEKIAELEKATVHEAARTTTTRRLLTMPGVGPITAMAIETFAPPMEAFKRGRDFAAWLGLVPRQHSTGGKQRLGRTSKMGQRDIRRLLIVGAMAVVRWAVRKGAANGSWLARMLAKKPRLVVAIALANKMARSIWAMLSKGEEYRGSALAPA